MGNGTKIFLLLMSIDIKLQEGGVPDLLVLDEHGIIIHEEIIMETIPVGQKAEAREKQGDEKVFIGHRKFALICSLPGFCRSV